MNIQFSIKDRQVLDALSDERIPDARVKKKNIERLRRVSRELCDGPYPPRKKGVSDDDCFVVLELLGERKPLEVWEIMSIDDAARIRGLAAKLR